jgi:hypothetical protein
MHDLLHIELVLFLGAAALSFVLWLFGLFKRQFLELLLQLVEALFVGMKKENLQEKMEEVYDCIGVRKYFLVRIKLFGDRVGFSADLSFEILDVLEVTS